MQQERFAAGGTREPLDFSRFDGMEGDRFVLRSITDEIMYELLKLSGQEYVDVYASSVKRDKPAKKKGGKSAARKAAERRMAAAA